MEIIQSVAYLLFHTCYVIFFKIFIHVKGSNILLRSMLFGVVLSDKLLHKELTYPDYFSFWMVLHHSLTVYRLEP